MRRRQVLQAAGGILTGLGLSYADQRHPGDRYAKVLAQDTRRKRALLVGINQYGGVKQGEWRSLRGAVTDVELQQELLIQRFGFHKDDILVLKDEQATRANLLQQFEQHLIAWAKPGDVVVFHYSGHGSTVADSDNVHGDGLNGTIVPWDSELPTGYPQVGGSVNDITAGTLFLLTKALNTDQVTVILDSCFSGGGVRGNTIVRSRSGQAELAQRGAAKLVSDPQELEYQNQWRSRLKLSPADWKQQRQQGVARGIALLAAQRHQEAMDITFAHNAHAGAFTHALVRHLWQQTSSQAAGMVVLAAATKTEQLLKTVASSRLQSPFSDPQVGVGSAQQPIYFTPLQGRATDAVITQIQGNQVRLLLTVDPMSVETLGRGASFRMMDANNQEIGTLQVESRDQLAAIATVQRTTSGGIPTGVVLQERQRAIAPASIRLRIGLDPSLAAETAIAKQRLQAIPNLEALPLLQQEVHYILGRVTTAYHQSFQDRQMKAIPPVGSVALFSPSLEPIPDSWKQPGETIKDAISRLNQKFKLLLAARIIKLTLNPYSSQLKVAAALQIDQGMELVAQQFTSRGGGQPIQPSQVISHTSSHSLAKLKVEQRIQVKVQNQESRNLFFGVILFSPDGDITPLEVGQQVVPPGEQRLLPTQYRLVLQPPLGMAEVLIIASTSSLEKALMALALLQPNQSRGETAIAAASTLLENLSTTTRGSSPSAPATHRIDPQHMAALSLAFEIVA